MPPCADVIGDIAKERMALRPRPMPVILVDACARQSAT